MSLSLSESCLVSVSISRLEALKRAENLDDDRPCPQQHPSLGPFVGLELKVQTRGCEVLDLADHQTGFRSLVVALVGLPSSLFFFEELTLAFQDSSSWMLYDRLVEVGLGAAG